MSKYFLFFVCLPLVVYKIHRVKVQFGADVDLSFYLYTKQDFDWRALDTIHLMINHRHYSVSPIQLNVSIFLIICWFLFSGSVLQSDALFWRKDSQDVSLSIWWHGSRNGDGVWNGKFYWSKNCLSIITHHSCVLHQQLNCRVKLMNNKKKITASRVDNTQKFRSLLIQNVIVYIDGTCSRETFPLTICDRCDGPLAPKRIA